MMFARSTTITAQPSTIDDGISNMRDQTMPALLGMQGCIGISLLVNRQSGQCIATSSWESEQAMLASESAVEPIRADATEHFGGSIDKVERWEIVLLHREHHATAGACVRCTWLQSPAETIDQAIEMFKTDVLPQAERMNGFCSASLFIDRASGRAVSATAWDNRDAMEGSRASADQLRAMSASRAGGRIVDVVEFDLAVAQLRVPEMA